MKGIFKAFMLSICLVLPTALCFAACSIEHAYGDDWTFDEDYHYQTCLDQNCQQVQNKARHNYGEWVVEVPATTKDAGNRYAECSDCHYKKTESIPALVSSGLQFKLNQTGLEYVVASIGTCTDDYISIPSEYYGLPVTEVADDAFKDSNIIGITFPDSIKEVSITAFSGCPYLGTMIFGKNLVSSGKLKKILDATPSVLNVSMSSTITAIPDDAFKGCSTIKNLEIPDSVVSIGDSAFDQCCGLANLVIPDSVTSISNHAFAWCSGIKNLTIGKGLTRLSNYIFGYCDALENVTFLGDLEILDRGVFRSCGSLKSITLPNSLTYIGYETFDYCTALESITIPDNVTIVGQNAFSRCSSLKSVICGKNLSKIDERAFYECGALESVEFSDSLTTLGSKAFGYCYTLDNIIIPTSLTTIDSYTFLDCQTLKSITLHKNVTAINSHAFDGCSSLQGVTIYNSLTYLGDDVFVGCTALVANYEYQNAYYLGSEENPYLVLYTAKDKEITSCQIHADTKFVNSEAFCDCSLLETVDIPNSIYGINSYAFKNCSALTNVTIPSSIRNFENSVFYNCTSINFTEYENGYYLGDAQNPYLILYMGKDKEITTCTIHENVVFIDRNALMSYNKLSSVYLPKTITSLQYGFLNFCQGLNDVYFDGTKQEWQNIEKESAWFMNMYVFTLHCTDGDISWDELRSEFFP